MEDVFDDYEKAYNSYAAVYNCIQDSSMSIDYFRHKAVLKDTLNMIFGAVGVVSLILALSFSFCFSKKHTCKYRSQRNSRQEVHAGHALHERPRTRDGLRSARPARGWPPPHD